MFNPKTRSVCILFSYRELKAYRDMSTREKSCVNFSWIVGERYAEDIVNDNEIVAEAQLSTFTKISASVLDKSVDLSLVESYCCGNMFSELQKLIQRKLLRPAWKCGTSTKAIGNHHSITCERCLQWACYLCSQLNEKHAGDWFCSNCATLIEKSTLIIYNQI